MTRTRLTLFSTTAFTSILAALPAFAQAPMPMAPAPAPMMAPAPVMAPAMATAPEAAVMPAAPVMAPKSPDDMSGSVGFGVGVVAGANDLIRPNTADLSMKYWLNDAIALLPKLQLSMSKAKDQDAAWKIAPAVLAEFGLLKGASTRFNAAVGLGLSFGKTPPVTTVDPTTGVTTTTGSKDVATEIYVPAGLNVEHFFTRWFSMGMGAYFNLIDFKKQGDGWSIGLDVNNITYLGSLFIYTD